MQDADNWEQAKFSLHSFIAIIMRRRGVQVSIHPGQQCGPCSLCGQKSPYYVHPLNFKYCMNPRRPAQMMSSTLFFKTPHQRTFRKSAVEWHSSLTAVAAKWVAHHDAASVSKQGSSVVLAVPAITNASDITIPIQEESEDESIGCKASLS